MISSFSVSQGTPFSPILLSKWASQDRLDHLGSLDRLVSIFLDCFIILLGGKSKPILWLIIDESAHPVWRENA